MGTDLLRAAVDAARGLGAPALFLEGDPGFYSGRGFKAATPRGFVRPSPRIPEPAFQVVVLDAHEPWMTGPLVFCDPFWVHDCVASATRDWLGSTPVRRRGVHPGKSAATMEPMGVLTVVCLEAAEGGTHGGRRDARAERDTGQERALPTGVDVARSSPCPTASSSCSLYGIVGNAGEAEDLVQEAFVRAYAAGSRFTRVDNPEAWSRTTAVNLHRNRWRKMRNFSRIKHRLHETPDLPGMSEHVEVVEALRQLPENQRVVLVLHAFADRQVHQIAESWDRRGNREVAPVARPRRARHDVEGGRP